MLYVIDNALQQADINTQASPGNFDNASIWQHMSQALHQSLDRVLTQLIAVLPGLLAFFVALAIFSLAGALLAWLLRQLLGWVKFDSRFARTIKSDWAPSSSPSEIISRVLFWGCVLLGLIIGVSAFDTSYATGAALPISLLPYLTHAVGAALLLIAGILIARFLARSVLISAINAQLQYARILSLGVKWLVLVLTAAMVLDHLQVGGNVVELAFGILSSAGSFLHSLLPWAWDRVIWSAVHWRAAWNMPANALTFLTMPQPRVGRSGISNGVLFQYHDRIWRQIDGTSIDFYFAP